jgi:hypothetical protein
MAHAWLVQLRRPPHQRPYRRFAHRRVRLATLPSTALRTDAPPACRRSHGLCGECAAASPRVSTRSTASTAASAGCETTAVLTVRRYSRYARQALKRGPQLGRCRCRAIVFSGCFDWNRQLWNGTSCQGAIATVCGCQTCLPCGTTYVATPVLADGSLSPTYSLRAVPHRREGIRRGALLCPVPPLVDIIRHTHLRILRASMRCSPHAHTHSHMRRRRLFGLRVQPHRRQHRRVRPAAPS